MSEKQHLNLKNVFEVWLRAGLSFLFVWSRNLNVHLVSAATVRPAWLRPALPTPSPPALSPAGGIRRHRRAAGHERLVEAAAGLRGGISRGVLPTGSTRGRSAPRLHAARGRAGERAGWRHLQGSALAAVLLLLRRIDGAWGGHEVSRHREDTLTLHPKCVRITTGQVAYIIY